MCEKMSSKGANPGEGSRTERTGEFVRGISVGISLLLYWRILIYTAALRLLNCTISRILILKYIAKKNNIPLHAYVLGHLKIIYFPFVPNGKFIIFWCPKTWIHCSLIIMCLYIRTPKNHHWKSNGVRCPNT